MNNKIKNKGIVIREPYSTDGPAVYDLIEECKPLDVNSRYCNLLQTLHFRTTSCAAECPNGELWGWISGYLIPEHENTLFIWQVAVSGKSRGLGLGKAMMLDIINRNNENGVKIEYIHTTITKDNKASWGMFKSLARDLKTKMQSTKMFDKEVHFDNESKSEWLVQLGPF